MPTLTIEFRDVLKLDPTIETEVLQGYPIYDEGHREELNRKIINHYLTREIGSETVSLFRHRLKTKLDEIMPLYNQQYEISAIKFNQLETIRINNTNATTGTTATNAESANTSKATAKSRAIGQQFPQVALAQDGDYATDGQDNVSETGANASATDNTTVNQDAETTSATTGFQGNAALMILQYRQSLVNVDMMVIDELQELFSFLWGNGDSFTDNNYYPVFGFGRFMY